MKRLVTRAIGAGGALAVLGALWIYSSRGTESNAAVGQPPSTPPTVMVAQPLSKSIVDWNEFSGRFEPSASIEIRARVSGYLQSINFEDGQLVEMGQPLFVIDPRPYRAAVAEAEARLSSARAQVDLANLELQRAEQLVGSAAVSRATYDQRNQQKRAADAAFETAEAALQRARLDLEFTEIKAPVTGRVSNRRVDPGSLVAGGDTLLTTIVRLDPIYFVFDMSERDFVAYERAMKSGKLRSIRDKGTPVWARLPDDDGWPYQGTMNFVDNRLELGSGTIRVRAVLPNRDSFITPGQFGRIRLPSSDEYDGILIPETALLTDQGERIVLTVGDDNVVKTKTVQLGPSQPGGLRVVREGLRPTDRIVINGLLRARAGAKVTPQAGAIAQQSQSAS
ncbi:efflux RND transporter periplasmic adaptor subunit [Bradyrhizobium sp. LHD-71]|uniref:efflux RND transporter periplasmic adaptor subunit n=1 Tax=Bradyrhizobium sp. LHD-71 TaxID=3072141 RepID=UPI00280DA665|nr:efflux RND transporter periplasmic adaptor subunit [Bradyrhizobium sp. LHD-71]MDQ8729293.1 efflux RND transporter periplasmic adaptor subunit [Bradyrhizobium sp. LHD-71]